MGELSSREDLTLSTNPMGISKILLERMTGYPVVDLTLQTQTRLKAQYGACEAALGNPHSIADAVNDRARWILDLRERRSMLRSLLAMAQDSMAVAATKLAEQTERVAGDESGLAEVDSRLQHAAALVEAHRAKTAALKGAMEVATYTPEKLAALRTVQSGLSADVGRLRAKVEQAEAKLSEFAALGPRFVQMATQYAQVRQEVARLRELKESC
ncbi:HAUS augmin-like complex subunit 4 [Carpediemonas membranifera]|uniref:HAUS augmin-like complex subunit 4 n=1 Tax=Carpediemonas membranifera TaxID=201153 RepID=A0A8J6E2X9_9EUKA|nr:HAUS augmin-like complex subunit 4 [Carpediemonas membranifera]|eukprot:KAG9394886.1 HAUS augmin-like complex subunit 4 [Carpediemonas membranifera]